MGEGESDSGDRLGKIVDMLGYGWMMGVVAGGDGFSVRKQRLKMG